MEQNIKYYGYIYIWFDTLAKFYYIGGHKGKIEDSYICSSRTMLRAYKLRPDTFRFRVLELVYYKDKLRSTEQKWLDMIKPSELMISENVLNKTCKYYNVKQTAAGGNGVGTNKGKSHTAWNKGLTKAQAPSLSRSNAKNIGRPRKYQNTMTIFKCENCGENFEAKIYWKRKFCGNSCAGFYNNKQRKV